MTRPALWIPLLALLAATPAGAQSPPAPENPVPVEKDLLVVLTLRGKPCDEIERHERLAPNDYLVTCSSGDRYRIRIEDDRVVIEDR